MQDTSFQPNPSPPGLGEEEVQIRPALSADIEVIAAFNVALAWETEARRLDLPVLRRGIARVLASPALGRYLVAELAGQVVGQTMITYELTDWRDGVIYWIQSVYVAAPFRRRGLYRKLYQAVQSAARRDPQARGLRLYVEQHNSVATATYERLGMERAPFYFYDAGL